MEGKCSICGRPVSPQLAMDLKKNRSGKDIVCAKCVSEYLQTEGIRPPICTNCGEPIDPARLQDFVKSRGKRGLPRRCGRCSRQGDPKLPPKRLHG